jgi:hypothetical protein
VLTDEGWAHILEEDAELADDLEAIILALEQPTIHRRGREPNESWYFLARAGPARWLHVVVHFFGNEGSATTAFGWSNLP